MFCKCLNLLKKLDYVRGRLGEERSDKVTGNNWRTLGRRREVYEQQGSKPYTSTVKQESGKTLRRKAEQLNLGIRILDTRVPTSTKILLGDGKAVYAQEPWRLKQWVLHDNHCGQMTDTLRGLTNSMTLQTWDASRICKVLPLLCPPKASYSIFPFTVFTLNAVTLFVSPVDGNLSL